MPGINAMRVLRAVRDRDLDLPLILMTGNPDVATASAAVEYGASHYLIKPIALSHFDETVQRAANAGRIARLRREYVEKFGSGTFATADRAGVDALLDRTLATLWMAYQPIVVASNSAGGVVAQRRTTTAPSGGSTGGRRARRSLVRSRPARSIDCRAYDS